MCVWHHEKKHPFHRTTVTRSVQLFLKKDLGRRSFISMTKGDRTRPTKADKNGDNGLWLVVIIQSEDPQGACPFCSDARVRDKQRCSNSVSQLGWVEDIWKYWSEMPLLKLLTLRCVPVAHQVAKSDRLDLLLTDRHTPVSIWRPYPPTSHHLLG